MAMQKLRYLASSAIKRVMGRGNNCPSCGAAMSKTVDTKWWVTELRRCAGCALMFRIPTTSHEENAAFYQEAYSQGFTSDCPADEQLAGYLAKGFAGTEKDYAAYLAVLSALGVAKGARIFDFGCSWGYGSWQLARAGFSVAAFEISKPRAAYASQKLAVNFLDPKLEPDAGYDCFFSAHVIEHVPSVREMFEVGMRLLKPGGLFVAFTPNGSDAYRRAVPEFWHRLWGLVHPQFLDDVFVAKLAAQRSWLVASNPYPLREIEGWKGNGTATCPLTGDELLLVIRKDA